jgi:hypothetical protein
MKPTFKYHKYTRNDSDIPCREKSRNLSLIEVESIKCRESSPRG